MDVTLHQLRLLAQVRDQGTISAAATAMHVTPSAASQQLSALEAAVGLPVLCRAGRGVQLTDAGHAMVRHADAVIRQIEAARADMEQMQTDVVGTIHLGVLESLTSSILPRLLTEMAARYPGLQLRTHQIETDALPRVTTGALDAAVVVDYPDAPGPRDNATVRHLLCRDWFKIVVPWEHPLRGPIVDLEALAHESMITSPLTTSCGRCIATACRQAGFEPDVVHQIQDYPGVLNLVAAGAGVALVADLGLLHPPPGVRILQPRRRICRHVELVYRDTSTARPSLRAFLEVLDLVADRAGLDRGGSERGAISAHPFSK